VAYSVVMEWSAELVDGVMQVTQDLGAASETEQVTYNLRCEKPSVDIIAHSNGRKVMEIVVPYVGDYTVTRRLRDVNTGVARVSTMFVNKDYTPVKLEHVEPSGSKTEYPKPKPKIRARKKDTE
jgi:hypothetical protein